MKHCPLAACQDDSGKILSRLCVNMVVVTFQLCQGNISALSG